MGRPLYKNTARMEMPTQIDGQDAVLVCYPASSDGYDEFLVELVTQEGAMQLACCGISHLEGNESNIHVYSYGPDAPSGPVAGMVFRPAAAQADVYVTDGRRYEASFDGVALGELVFSAETPASYRGKKDDLVAFVGMLNEAYRVAGGSSLEHLRGERALELERRGSREILKLNGHETDVTGLSLMRVSDEASALIALDKEIRERESANKEKGI